MKNILKGITLLFAILMTIFVIIPKVWDLVKYTGKKDIQPNGLTFQDAVEKLEEEQKNTASDIEGWTVYDKTIAGLSPYDGSDSDGDGLTDKEEIEVYGSDPLKKSTAGDFYTDKYKSSGLDNHYSFQPINNGFLCFIH